MLGMCTVSNPSFKHNKIYVNKKANCHFWKSDMFYTWFYFYWSCFMAIELIDILVWCSCGVWHKMFEPLYSENRRQIS